MTTPILFSGRIRYIKVDMDDSPWSVRFEGGPGGVTRISLHWNDKDTPTHEAQVNANELVAKLEEL